jgi:hypothetical protein
MKDPEWAFSSPHELAVCPYRCSSAPRRKRRGRVIEQECEFASQTRNIFSNSLMRIIIPQSYIFQFDGNRLFVEENSMLQDVALYHSYIATV